MLIQIMLKMRHAPSAFLLMALAACGTNPATTDAAPPALKAPAAPAVVAPAEPAPPVAPPTSAVQAAPDPATREGRMAEALKGYEASKAAPQSTTKKPPPAKQPIKRPAKAASSPGN
jgi:hypothetical protein